MFKKLLSILTIFIFVLSNVSFVCASPICWEGYSQTTDFELNHMHLGVYLQSLNIGLGIYILIPHIISLFSTSASALGGGVCGSGFFGDGLTVVSSSLGKESLKTATQECLVKVVGFATVHNFVKKTVTWGDVETREYKIDDTYYPQGEQVPFKNKELLEEDCEKDYRNIEFRTYLNTLNKNYEPKLNSIDYRKIHNILHKHTPHIKRMRLENTYDKLISLKKRYLNLHYLLKSIPPSELDLHEDICNDKIKTYSSLRENYNKSSKKYHDYHKKIMKAIILKNNVKIVHESLKRYSSKLRKINKFLLFDVADPVSMAQRENEIMNEYFTVLKPITLQEHKFHLTSDTKYTKNKYMIHKLNSDEDEKELNKMEQSFNNCSVQLDNLYEEIENDIEFNDYINNPYRFNYGHELYKGE